MVLPVKLLLVVQALHSLDSVLISSFRCPLIPYFRLLKINRNVDPDFVEVPHRKFRRCQTRLRCALSVLVSKFVVLSEEPLMTAEKPLADSHLGLGLTLPRSQCVVM